MEIVLIIIIRRTQALSRKCWEKVFSSLGATLAPPSCLLPLPERGAWLSRPFALMFSEKLQVLINLLWCQLEQKASSFTTPHWVMAFRDVFMTWGGTDHSLPSAFRSPGPGKVLDLQTSTPVQPCLWRPLQCKSYSLHSRAKVQI